MNNKPCLVLATQNEHKIKEIKEILGSILEYRILSDYVAIQVKEAGRTLLENSLAKALYAHKVTGLPALADDSGLFIDALDGEPGIFSARYGNTDTQRISRVLEKLQGRNNRCASFRAVFVLVLDSRTHKEFVGICPGSITNEPQGTHGFGYDPIFVPDGYNNTFAELGAETKNRISHRALALNKVKIYFSK